MRQIAWIECGRRGATAQARNADGGARSGGGAERCGERGRVPSVGGANGTAGTVSNALRRIGDITAHTKATITFFGGQSMFLLKLGAWDAGSSFCPTRVSAGTHTSTATPSNTAARASRSPKRRA